MHAFTVTSKTEQNQRLEYHRIGYGKKEIIQTGSATSIWSTVIARQWASSRISIAKR